MKRGYIHLWRRIWDNWTWKKSFPKSKAEAWIDLILMAQGVPKKVMIEGQEQILKRGQILTSILTLSRRWGWNRNKVRFFLKRLSTQSRHKKDTKENADAPQIGQQKGHTYLIITIYNYRLYNPLSGKKDTKKDTKEIKKGHQEETQKDTTKKDKEGLKKKEPPLPPISNDIEIIMFQWNEFAEKHDLTQIKGIEKKSQRRARLIARMKSKGFDFKALLTMIENSPFLLAQTKAGFRVFFDWIIKPTNYQKIIEGTYLDKKKETYREYMERKKQEESKK